MELAIIIVWTIGLIGALVATLVILKEVTLIIGALKDILRLSEHTRDAARGLARNVEAVDRLAGVNGPAGQLYEATSKLALRAVAISQRMNTLANRQK
jgi:hypothetical protein